MRTFAELEQIRAAAGPAPRERGVVRLLCRRLGDGLHECPPQARLTLAAGFEGDRWARSPRRRTGEQVTLMETWVAAAVAADHAPLHQAGDNLLVDLDLGAGNLPPGTRVRVGGAVLEIDPAPHTGCKKFRERFGREALDWVNHPDHGALRLRGVNCRVVAEGEVAVGDAIEVLRPGAAREKQMQINGGRLWDSLMQLAKVGATEKGGVRRIALTSQDAAGRDLVTRWLREAGLEVRIDRMGNIFGRRPGTDPQRAPVGSGSHIDTQPSGGKFDGNFGVLAALEVVRTLNDHGAKTAAPIEVCIWTNEEGTRYTPVMMGSGTWAGVFTTEAMHERPDIDGVKVGDELRRIGYLGDAPVGPSDRYPGFSTYYEAHIEQGPILEDEDKVIGIVTGALGQRWFDVVVDGMDAHAGPTPMHLRRDALLATAKVVEAVNRIAIDENPHGRGTVGFVQVEPNSRNVIPGRVKFSVDLRHLDAAGLDRMEAALRKACAEIAGGVDTRLGGIAIDVKMATEFPPCHFDKECVDAVRRAARDLDLPAREIVSGAGHDSVYVARRCPTAMVFVPCKDGISHNEIEDARADHLEAGCNVLLRAILERAT